MIEPDLQIVEVRHAIEFRPETDLAELEAGVATIEQELAVQIALDEVSDYHNAYCLSLAKRGRLDRHRGKLARPRSCHPLRRVSIKRKS